MSAIDFPAIFSLTITPGYSHASLNSAGYKRARDYVTGNKKTLNDDLKSSGFGWAGRTDDGKYMTPAGQN